MGNQGPNRTRIEKIKKIGPTLSGINDFRNRGLALDQEKFENLATDQTNFENHGPDQPKTKQTKKMRTRPIEFRKSGVLGSLLITIG